MLFARSRNATHRTSQDTGKSTFDPRRKLSSIDLSRAGAGLMEIVSEPDMRSVCKARKSALAQRQRLQVTRGSRTLHSRVASRIALCRVERWEYGAGIAALRRQRLC